MQYTKEKNQISLKKKSVQREKDKYNINISESPEVPLHPNTNRELSNFDEKKKSKNLLSNMNSKVKIKNCKQADEHPQFIMAQSEKVECFNKQQNIFDDLSDFYADDNEFEQIDLDKDSLNLYENEKPAASNKNNSTIKFKGSVTLKRRI